MATTKRDRVGRVREKLSALLDAVGIEIQPENLSSQIPVYATAQWDCCSWYGDGYSRTIREQFALPDDGPGNMIHVFSYDTMTMCARYGIELSGPDGGHIEISAKRPTNGRETMTRED